MKLAGIIFSIGLSFSTMAQVNENLSVVDTVCEYQHDPVGIDVVQPRFSWKLSSPGSSILQSHYEIRVATSTQALETGKGLAWNSGRVKSGQSQLVAYQGSPLESKKRYYWKVRVWDNQGGVSSWSGDSFWEMGLLKPSDWQASWIALPQKTNGEIGAPPMFRKTFTVSKPVKAARLYITSYGIYEASLNASRVSRDYFRPGWTSFNKRLQYQTYDVTEQIRQGPNVAGVVIGDGWYRGYLGFLGQKNLYGKELALLFQLQITYGDGSTQTIHSDNTWKVSTDGPIRKSELYNGERYDARMDSEWETPSFND